MRHPEEIEQIDRLLDELEILAETEKSPTKFFNEVLQRLEFLLHANAAFLLRSVDNQSWVPIAVAGNLDPGEATRQVSKRLLEEGATEQAELKFSDEKQHWIGCALREEGWGAGGIVVALDQSVPAAALSGLLQLLPPFAELIRRYQVDALFEENEQLSQQVFRTISRIHRSTSLAAASALLANDLQAIVKADRVSFVRFTESGQVLGGTVSGSGTYDRRSETVKGMERLAKGTIARAQTTVCRYGKAIGEGAGDIEPLLQAGGLPHSLCIPFGRASSQSERSNALLFEWKDPDQFVRSAMLFRWVLPITEVVWDRTKQWVELPLWVRWFSGTREKLGTRLFRYAKLLAIMVAVILGIAWIALIPTQFRIEGRGVLEPAQQRMVFSMGDGYIEKLYVEDGQSVKGGDPLLQLKSPTLDIQIQECDGEQKALLEKRKGIDVAINQILPDDPQGQVAQSRLAAEIREIDQRLINLKAKQTLLIAEKEKLLIRAPIAGTVVAWELKRNLESRPVRRGEALLRIAAIDGPWQLRISVPDYEAGHITQREAESSEPIQTDFVLASSPKNPLAGTVREVANNTQNPLGNSPSLEILVDIDKSKIEDLRIGATAIAQFNCGERSWWYVWSRPLVEAVQRRLWY